MTQQFPQHAFANHRIPSDTWLHPDHYDFKGDIDSEIKLLKEMYEYIEITNDQVVNLREASNNSKNFGDCIEEILYKELAGYSGMIDGGKLTNETLEYFEHPEEDIATVRRKKVFESLYDSTNKSIYYFLK